LLVNPDSKAPAIETRGLSKSYAIGHLFWRRRRPALTGLDLRVERGEVFGYLGPNGSGKTTTLKLLTGLLFPDAGGASILGRPLADRSWRFLVGYLPENPYLYDYLTAEEYLQYVGRLFAMSPRARRDRSQHLLSLVGLSGSARVPLRRYSKGMLQRAGLAQALMNDPELVILDEPMSGLDPIGRRLVRNIILDLKKAGKTVLFSTHILSDAETLCDRVAVLKSGRLLDVGPLDTILKIDVTHVEVLVAGIDGGQLGSKGIRSRQPLGERWRLEVDEDDLGNVVRLVEQGHGRILSVQPIRQSLEDYFFKEMASGGGEANRWEAD
jgi:ABC-2 type transport system ATP-binding protein